MKDVSAEQAKIIKKMVLDKKTNKEIAETTGLKYWEVRDYGQEGKGSPSQASATERLAIKRAELQEKCERIEQTAIEADADIYQWLLEGVTTDYATYIYLRDAKGLPCGDQKYYRARRKFYWLMSKKI